jgi:hypothetical protein
MKRPFLITLAPYLFLSGGFPGGLGAGELEQAPGPEYDPVAVERASTAITPETLYPHVAYLASDDLGGRGTPSPGLEMAAEYMAERFDSYGLQPAGDAGTFIQRWHYETASPEHDAVSLTYQAKGKVHSLEYGADFVVFPADQERVEGEAVYLGTVADLRAGFPPEVAGKVALVLISLTEPGFDGERVSRAAADAGALAFGLIMPPGVPLRTWFPDVAGIKTNQPILGLPNIMLGYGSAARVLAAAGLDLDAMRKSDSDPVAPVGLSGVSLTLEVPLDRVSSEPPNVVAVLPGSDPELRETHVVYTAHLDGLGIGLADASGDSIYNSANDNASGSAALLEIARAFTSLPRPPARSVVFLSVGGEEVGYFGSRHFVQNPTVPVSGMVVNLNIDCIARGTDDDEYEISEEYVTPSPLARQVVDDHPSMRLTEAPDKSIVAKWLGESEADYFRSDHGSFAVAGIPFFIFGGGFGNDRHQPSDEIDRLDLDKAAHVARLYFTLGAALANDPNRQEWKEGSLEHIRDILWWF